MDDFNSDRPEINLDKIKEKVVTAIKDFEDSKSNISVKDLDFSDIDKDILDSRLNDVYINGAKNTRILRAAILSSIDKDLKIKGTIIFKKIYKATTTDAPPNYVNRGGGFYFYVIFSEHECVIYQLDNFYRLQQTYRYGKECFDRFFIAKHILFMKFNDKNNKTIYSDDFILMTFSDEPREFFKELIDVLNSSGFKEVKNGEEKDKMVGYRFGWIIFVTCFALPLFLGLSLVMNFIVGRVH